MTKGNIPAERGYSSPKITNMDAFDKLPAALRAALRDADHNWSAAQLYLETRKPKAKRKPQVMTTADAIAFLRESDRALHREYAERGLVCPGQR